jgi:hypothetical protein
MNNLSANPQTLRCHRWFASIVLVTAFSIPLLWSSRTCALGAATTGAPAGMLLAVNEGESTLGIIDPRSSKQVAKVAEGDLASWR